MHLLSDSDVQAAFGYQPASQWFTMYERRLGEWKFMGWIYTDWGAVQMLAMHLVQARVGLGMPELRYLIGDEHGNGVVPDMRPPYV